MRVEYAHVINFIQEPTVIRFRVPTIVHLIVLIIMKEVTQPSLPIVNTLTVRIRFGRCLMEQRSLMMIMLHVHPMMLVVYNGMRHVVQLEVRIIHHRAKITGKGVKCKFIFSILSIS